MKKQTLAKILVLCLVALMLPIAAFAVDNSVDSANYYADTNVDVKEPDRNKADATKKEEATTAPVETATEVKVVDGVAEVAAQVSGSTATVTLTADAVTSMVAQATGSELVLDVASTGSATEVVVDVPAAALADLKADLKVASTVADITISNSDLATIVAGATNVQISAKVDGDKIVISVVADGTAVAGVPVKVAVPAAEGAVIYLVAADGTETVIEDVVFENGTAILTVDANSTIRIG